MQILEFPHPLPLEAGEVYRLMGYPAPAAASDQVHRLVREALRRAAEWLRPWVGLWEVGLRVDTAVGVELADGPAFRSLTLARLLADCPRAVLCLATIGEGLEQEATRQAREGRAAEAFVLDAIGSAAVEALQREVGQRLCALYEPAGLHVTRHYSPGYAGWPMEDQRLLFQYWSARGDALPVRLSEGAMMLPRKSLTSIWGLIAEPLPADRSPDRIGCADCDMAACGFRRVPYRLDEAVAPPVGGSDTAAQTAPAPAAPRAAPAGVRPVAYAMSAKALGKWARELLTSEPTGDRAIHFRFRYLGSTCSGGGTPINALLHAIIRPGPQGMIFEKGWIEIPKYDAGLQSMCEYNSRREAYFDDLACPPAFCGQTLEQILDQTMAGLAINPAGCLCRPPQVNHKWRMALSTIHYALSLAAAASAAPAA